jgi:hypothetical protein
VKEVEGTTYVTSLAFRRGEYFAFRDTRRPETDANIEAAKIEIADPEARSQEKWRRRAAMREEERAADDR